MAFIILFAVIFGFAFIFYFTLLIVIHCNKIGLRYLTHLSWNCMTLITIPLLILSCVFGVLGTALILIPSFVEVLLSQDGLNKFASGKSIDLLNACFNGDGNMRPILMPDQAFADTFDSFYNISMSLNNITEQFQDSKSSQLAKTTKDLYVSMDANIVLAPTVDSNSPANVVLSLNTYTQSSATNTKLSSCSSTTDDVWVSDKTSCPSGFNYIDFSNPTSGVGSKSCLNIREWTSSNIQSRYKDRNICSGSSNVNVVDQYISKLNSYADEASPILKDLRDDIDITVTVKLSSSLNEAQKVYNPILGILKDITGDLGLWGLINCRFMSENMGQVLNTVQDTGTVSIAICACLATLSFLNWILLFFGLTYLNRFISSSDKKIDVRIDDQVESKVNFNNVRVNEEPGQVRSDENIQLKR